MENQMMVLEIGKMLGAFTEKINLRLEKLETGMQEGFARIDKRLDEIDVRLGEIDVRLEQIDERLEEADRKHTLLQVEMQQGFVGFELSAQVNKEYRERIWPQVERNTEDITYLKGAI